MKFAPEVKRIPCLRDYFQRRVQLKLRTRSLNVFSLPLYQVKAYIVCIKQGPSEIPRSATTLEEFIAELKEELDKRALPERVIDFLFTHGSFVLQCYGEWMEFGVFEGKPHAFRVLDTSHIKGDSTRESLLLSRSGEFRTESLFQDVKYFGL